MVRARFRKTTVFLHSTKLPRKLHHVHYYVRKSSSCRNVEKLPFDQSQRLTVYRLQHKLRTKFVKAVSKILVGVQEELLSQFLFSKLQAYKLQPSALQVFKIWKNSGNSVYCAVPFSRSRRKKVIRKACKCTSKGFQHGCSTEKLLNI